MKLIGESVQLNPLSTKKKASGCSNKGAEVYYLTNSQTTWQEMLEMQWRRTYSAYPSTKRSKRGRRPEIYTKPSFFKKLMAPYLLIPANRRETKQQYAECLRDLTQQTELEALHDVLKLKQTCKQKP